MQCRKKDRRIGDNKGLWLLKTSAYASREQTAHVRVLGSYSSSSWSPSSTLEERLVFRESLLLEW